MNNWFELHQLRTLARECDIVWVGYCGWYTVVRHIKGKPMIFDKMDEEDLLVSSGLLKRTLQRNKRRMVWMASAVTVTCRQFYEELKSEKEKVFLVPNAVSDNFTAGMGEAGIAFEKLSRVKTFGYVGTIGEWFDESVIYKLLALDRQYEIFLVGRNYLPRIAEKRVHYLGVKENCKLPEIIQQFDVCLYNFKKSPLLDTINPVKLYEYLSLNKPVLAVKSKETLQFQEYAALYDDVEELGEVIRNGLKRPFADRKSLKKFIDSNSWSARTVQIEKILREEAAGKL